jgi:hypothetical protein
MAQGTPLILNGENGIFFNHKEIKQLNKQLTERLQLIEHLDSLTNEYDSLGVKFDQRGMIIQLQQMQMEDMSNLHKEQMRKTKLVATGTTILSVGLLIKLIFF